MEYKGYIILAHHGHANKSNNLGRRKNMGNVLGGGASPRDFEKI